jgi:hypothetical protein
MSGPQSDKFDRGRERARKAAIIPDLTFGRSSYRWFRQAGATLVGVVSVLVVAPCVGVNALGAVERAQVVAMTEEGMAFLTEPILVVDPPPHVQPAFGLARIKVGNLQEISCIEVSTALSRSAFGYEQDSSLKNSYFKVFPLVGRVSRAINEPCHVFCGQIAGIMNDDLAGKPLGVIKKSVNVARLNTQISALEDFCVFFLPVGSIDCCAPQISSGRPQTNCRDCENDGEECCNGL